MALGIGYHWWYWLGFFTSAGGGTNYLLTGSDNLVDGSGNKLTNA